MRLYDVEQSAQQDIIDDRPAFDKSSFGSEDFERGLPKPKFSKEMFVGFK